MTSIIKMTALSGTMDESPPCYLLQVDEFRILLDCGWDELFSMDFVKELKRHVHHIDAVLLSYPDVSHLGALPYMVGKCGLSCPVFATIPVYKMGQMFMYDLFQSHHNMEDFDLFNLDDIDAAFDKIIQLKYNQSVPMKANILQTLRNNGNVLVAVDTAGRVLELTHMLEQLWRNKDSGLVAYSLALLNNVSYNVVEFAKSQIEWMSDKLMKSFEGARNNPFHFKHVKLCHSLAELSKVPSPKVVLVSTPDMECGFSRDLFFQWCSSPENSIIITNRTSPGTLARDLIELGGNRTLTLQVKKRIRLEGEELEEYQKKKDKDAKDKQDKEKEAAAASSESEDEDMTSGGAVKGKHDLLVKTFETNKPGQSRFFKSNKKQFPMFPFHETKIKYDEYGEVIRPEQYKILEIAPEVEDNKDNDSDKDDELADILEYPSKCVQYYRTVTVEAQVQFIDFEGRADGEAVMKLITQMKPRNLILVRGPSEATELVADYVEQHCGDSTRIFKPRKLQMINATTESHIFQVKLTDALVSRLKFQKVRNGEIAWVDSKVVDKEKTPFIMEVDEEDLDTAVIPVITIDDTLYTLEHIPKKVILPHEPQFINELQLSDFKQILQRNGIDCEFMDGVLICCRGSVAVRRADDSDSNVIVLEASVMITAEFNTVTLRRTTYSHY
uniref:Cleavage and polyadenylation specificity factor subunit 2 n=1 Tax=Cacopsylla melanoneura TaxID=428564 RepID=A0A8D8R2H2_9HEMI